MAERGSRNLSDADSTPVGLRPQLPRRTFLKAIGATVAGVVGPILPIPEHLAAVAAAPAPAPFGALVTAPPPPGVAQTIAAASPLVHQALAELKAYDLVFDVKPTNFVHAGDHGSLVGLTLRHRQSPSRRTGADLILTVDGQANSLVAVQFLVAWCLDGSLELQSTLLDLRRGEYQVPWTESRPPTELPIMRKPRRVHHWTFVHDAPPPPESLPASGWPPDRPERCEWYYHGCIGTEWAEEHGLLFQRARQVAEQRSCQPDPRHVVELGYQDPVPLPLQGATSA